LREAFYEDAVFLEDVDVAACPPFLAA
jgi:hypothetical protein